MAIIKKFERVNKPINLYRQTKTNVRLTVDDQRRWLKLETFGSENREFQGQASQNIIFDEEALQKLKEVLEELGYIVPTKKDAAAQ